MPIDPVTQAYLINDSGVFHQGSGSGRNYGNELNYVRNILTGGIDDPYLRDILTKPVDPNQLTTEELLKRAQATYGARDLEVGGYNVGDYIGQINQGQGALSQYAYETFRSMVGREPTEREFASVLPYFQGVNGRQTGAAYLAQFAEQEARSPEALARRAGEFSGDVNRLFGETIGRTADQDEIDYYGRLLASNQITPYEVEQLLRNTPEYRTAEDTRFREGLAGELEGYDLSFFNKAQEGVRSRAARAGGGVATSSALDFALTNLMGDIAKERGSYLANLSAGQYGGNKAAAREDYLGTMNRYLGERDYERSSRDRERDYFRSRSDQNLDYMIQRDDYLNYLNSQKRRQNPYGQLIGGLVGAGIGAGLSKSPQGAQAGYNIGSGAGGFYDYLNY